jgi:hypothetical protein
VLAGLFIAGDNRKPMMPFWRFAIRSSGIAGRIGATAGAEALRRIRP